MWQVASFSTMEKRRSSVTIANEADYKNEKMTIEQLWYLWWYKITSVNPNFGEQAW